jgi:hypothetical protein
LRNLKELEIINLGKMYRKISKKLLIDSESPKLKKNHLPELELNMIVKQYIILSKKKLLSSELFLMISLMLSKYPNMKRLLKNIFQNLSLLLTINLVPYIRRFGVDELFYIFPLE